MGADDVTTSPPDISAKLDLKGQNVHSTSFEASGGSRMVPHWGQNGQLVDDELILSDCPFRGYLVNKENEEIEMLDSR